jgi:hypothetical protein
LALLDVWRRQNGDHRATFKGVANETIPGDAPSSVEKVAFVRAPSASCESGTLELDTEVMEMRVLPVAGGTGAKQPAAPFTVVSEIEHRCLRLGEASPATVTLHFEKLLVKSAGMKTENAQLKNKGTPIPALEGVGVRGLRTTRGFQR